MPEQDISKKASLFGKKLVKDEKDENKPVPPTNVKRAEEAKKKKSMKTNELLDSEHTLKLCEFILYEFDISNPSGIELFNPANSTFIYFSFLINPV